MASAKLCQRGAMEDVRTFAGTTSRRPVATMTISRHPNAFRRDREFHVVFAPDGQSRHRPRSGAARQIDERGNGGVGMPLHEGRGYILQRGELTLRGREFLRDFLLLKITNKLERLPRVFGALGNHNDVGFNHRGGGMVADARRGRTGRHAPLQIGSVLRNEVSQPRALHHHAREAGEKRTLRSLRLAEARPEIPKVL